MSNPRSRFEHFVGELKRRLVVRVAIVYMAAAFAIVEAADIVIPVLALPSWTLKLLIIAALVGLPIAIALSWAFEFTSEGIVRTQSVDAGYRADEPLPPWLTTRSLVVVGLVLLATVGVSAGVGGWLIRGTSTSGQGDSEITSVAVLPFENLSDDPANEYFSDGLADELSGFLARIDGLRVAGRSSAWVFKNRGQDVQTVGEALGVGAVLEGSVRKSGERVRISAQLVDTRDGFQLWSARFDRTVDDIFAVQEEIARSIVSALRVELGVEETTPIVQPLTTDPMAHDKYLWGRFNLNRQTEEGVLDAIDNFQMAVSFDSTFAEAFVGLADAQLALVQRSGDVDVPRAIEAAGTATETALRLKPDLAEGWASLGLVRFHELRWREAEADYERALEANPDDPVVRQRYSELLATLGRSAEALAQARASVELDPLSTVAWTALLRALRTAGAYAEAIRAGQEILKLNDREASAWLALGLLFLLEERPRDASDALERYAELQGGDPAAFAAFAEVAHRFASSGTPGRVPVEVSRMVETRPIQLAVFHQLVGDSDAALESIERAQRQRSTDLATMNTRPELEPLREHPRFQEVIAALGLEGS